MSTVGFVAREKELAKLNQAIESNEAEFIALYGRRRVGKTSLVRQCFVKKKPYRYFEVVGLKDGSTLQQLAVFNDELNKIFYPKLSLSPSETWFEALKMLTTAIDEVPADQRVVIFLDEVPWLATVRSGFLEALDHYWNACWVKFPNLKLIVCGSAASWIINNIVDAKGGLHNRVTCSIALAPFTLKEVKTYLNSRKIVLSDFEIMTLYMVMGGVPHYFKAVSRGLSPTQIINNLSFKRDGLLFKEFNNLFSSLFKNAEIYEELIRIMAQTRIGLTKPEIVRQSKLSSSGGRLTKRLTELEESGFIQSYVPNKKSNKTFYRLIDEYSLFYLTWIEPMKNSLLMTDDSSYWELKCQSAAWKAWSGYAFESICFKHIDIIICALGIKHLVVDAHAWRYLPKSGSSDAPGAQIDLVLIRNDGVISLCEMKFSQQPYRLSKQAALNLKNKVDVYRQQTKTKQTIFIALITSSHLVKNDYSFELISNQVTLEDFFE